MILYMRWGGVGGGRQPPHRWNRGAAGVSMCVCVSVAFGSSFGFVLSRCGPLRGVVLPTVRMSASAGSADAAAMPLDEQAGLVDALVLTRRLETRASNLQAKVANFEARVANVTARLSDLQVKVASLEESDIVANVASLQATVSTLAAAEDEQRQNVPNQLRLLEADRWWRHDIEARVERLESDLVAKVASLDATVGSLVDTVATLEETAANLEAMVSSLAAIAAAQ